MNVAPVQIPARITVRRLAQAIDRPESEVVAVLKSRGEPDAPQDVVDHEVAASVASALGCEVRVEARDLALEVLYEFETRGELADLPQGRVADYVLGVTAGLEDLDSRIEEASEHWSVSRMPAVDRNILRLAVYELENHPETSTGVILSEAIRLAQTYSTEKSSSFVNGVLAAIAGGMAERSTD